MYVYTRSASGQCPPRWRSGMPSLLVLCSAHSMQCTLIYFVGNKPFVIPPVRIKRYERIIWTEKGEIFFTEEATLDYFEWFHELPRKTISVKILTTRCDRFYEIACGVNLSQGTESL